MHNPTANPPWRIAPLDLEQAQSLDPGAKNERPGKRLDGTRPSYLQTEITHPATPRRFAHVFANLCLVFFSAAATIGLCEAAVRVLCPKYKYAADAQFGINQSRIFQHQKNRTFFRKHPDSDADDLIIYNSLGLRQHREFSVNKPDGVVRIAFFGDSYVENRRMAVQYSFTEPLEYLLNKTGKRYEVLNFGTDGYGTDQEYLQYLQEGIRVKPDYVFLVPNAGDLRNINENDLFRLDRPGRLVRRPYRESRMINIINKFYLTYLILDCSERLRLRLSTAQTKILKPEYNMRHNAPEFQAVSQDFKDGIVTADVKKTEDIFSALLFQMKKASEENGSKFNVVTLPHKAEETMSDLLVELGFAPINLYDRFDKIYPDESSYRFKNDGHWNEEGNKLAAVFLFKFLARELSIPHSDDEFIEQALYEYYGSFPPPSMVSARFIKKHANVSPALNDRIRAKYLALEKSP